MDKQRSELATQVPPAEYEPWWGIPRFQVGLLIFSAVFGASTPVYYGPGEEGRLVLLACLGGSLVATPLIMYLAERVFRRAWESRGTRETDRG